ncbi:MAG: nucleotide sugar dehydrogenase [Patescibacteria group bacterium]
MKIDPKLTKIAVCGLGYVGFPIALLFARAGFVVIGVDLNEQKIRLINRGSNPIEGKEPGLKELIRQVQSKGNLEATSSTAAYQDADFIIVAVETPVDEKTNEPGFEALKSALFSIGQNIKKGVLISIESTIAPGTMKKIVQPILEQQSGLVEGKDFDLVHCPERLMPGHLLENINNYNRVLGGSSKATAIAKSLYQKIVKGQIDQTDWLTAEIVKAGENAYRDVQIAFANEMALFCEALGANVWEVRRLINNCRRRGETRPEALRQMHFPGAGVGGHCIPKDPWLLTFGAKGLIEPQIVPLARRINKFMPRHMFDLLGQALREIDQPIAKSKIVVLGYAYAGNSDDCRNSPTEDLLKYLAPTGAEIIIHDPYVKEYKKPLQTVLKSVHALILMADHDQYKKLKIKNIKKIMRVKKPIIIDGRNVFDKQKAIKEGFIYRGVGNI